MNATARTLIAARDLLAQGADWWTQGKERREAHGPLNPFDHPQYCAVGALRAVSAGGGAQMADAIDTLARFALPKVDPTSPAIWHEPTTAVTSWNDAARRSYAEVINLFAEAIRLATAGTAHPCLCGCGAMIEHDGWAHP